MQAKEVKPQSSVSNGSVGRLKGPEREELSGLLKSTSSDHISSLSSSTLVHPSSAIRMMIAGSSFAGSTLPLRLTGVAA